MQKLLFVSCLLAMTGCSVIKSPSSWNAKPLVIDPSQTYFNAIITAADGSALIAQGNSIQTEFQSLLSTARKNLDRTSGGNYGVGLVAAAVGLSNLHSDALLGAGYLAGTHVALSNRLSPTGYMQQLHRSSQAFYCLNQAGLAYAGATQKAETVAQVAGFTVTSNFTAMGYSSDISSYGQIDLEKFKQFYLRALDLSQQKLDAQISLSTPVDIQSQLVESTKKAAASEIEIDSLTDGDALKDFLTEHEKLESELLACIAII